MASGSRVPEKTRTRLSRPTYGSLVVLTISATSGPSGSHDTAGATTPAGVNTSGGTCSGGAGKARVARSSSSAQPTPVTEHTGTTGWKLALRHRPLEVGHQDVLGDLLALQVAVHEALVLGLLDHGLDQRAAQLVVGVLAGREQPGQRGDVLTLADGQVERHDLVAEGALRLLEYAVVVGTGLVELGDHHGPGHAHLGTLPPQGAGPGVHALVGRDHEQGAVGSAESGSQLTDEVGIPGGVDEVDLDAVVDQGGERQGDGPLVGLLGVLEVRDGGPVPHRARTGDGPC